MRFGFWPAPSNPWADILDVASHAERTGWDGLWFADHFMPNQADMSGPTHEAWTALTALAALVPRVRVGHLVNGNTYRHPAVVAKMAATADIVSGGRFTLGLGAGWQENEHRAYGIPFYTLRERLERLEETCQIVTSLFREEQSSFQGKHYEIVDAPLAPKPVQSPLPLMVGGGGEKVTLRIAARYAEQWNVWGLPDVLEHKIGVLESHCKDATRDPAAIHKTAAVMLVLTDDKDLAAASRGAARPVMAGDAGAIKQIVQGYIDVGVDEIIVPDFNMGPNPAAKKAVMDRFMQEVVSEFR